MHYGEVTLLISSDKAATLRAPTQEFLSSAVEASSVILSPTDVINRIRLILFLAIFELRDSVWSVAHTSSSSSHTVSPLSGMLPLMVLLCIKE